MMYGCGTKYFRNKFVSKYSQRWYHMQNKFEFKPKILFGNSNCNFIPIIPELEYYFGDKLIFCNNNNNNNMSHCIGLNVVVSPRYNLNIWTNNKKILLNDIVNNNWIYDIKSDKIGGLSISNNSTMDGLIYAFYSYCMADANLMTFNSSYTYLPSFDWSHIKNLNYFNKYKQLLIQQRLLLNSNYKYPPIILISKADNIKSIKQFLFTSKIIYHKNSMTNDYCPIFFVSTKSGINNIKNVINDNINNNNNFGKRFESFDISENGLIKYIECNYNENVGSFDFKYLLSKLYNEMNIKNVTIESGATLMRSFLQHKCLSQLNITLMHDSILKRKKIIKDETDLQYFDLFNSNNINIEWMAHYLHQNDEKTNTNCSLGVFSL